MVFVTTLARFFTIASLVSSFTALLTDVWQSYRRLYLAQRILRTTHTLTLSATSPPFFAASGAVALRDSLLADAAEMEFLNSNLYLNRLAYMGAANVALYQAPSVTLMAIRPSLSLVAPVTISTTMWDAVKLFAVKARQVAALPLNAINDNEANSFFVLANGEGPFISTLNQSATYYATDTRVNVGLILAWDVSFTVFSIALVAIVIVTVIRSHIWLVEENKMHVLRLFVSIPTPFLKSFEKSCSARLHRLELQREKFLHGDAEELTAAELVEEEVDGDEQPLLAAETREKDKLQVLKEKDATSKKMGVDRSEGLQSKHVTLLKVCIRLHHYCFT